jgi:hypothetical protein
MGFLLGIIILSNDEVDVSGNRLLPWYSNIARAIALGTSLLWIITMLIVLFSADRHSFCQWCRYIDCFDSALWTCPQYSN